MAIRARAKGDRIANWAIQTAGTTGLHYLIWYGSLECTHWAVEPYNGGGVYDPSDATGATTITFTCPSTDSNSEAVHEQLAEPGRSAR